MTVPPFVGLVMGAVQSQTLNVSPKVAVPGFVGMASACVICALDHYGIKVDVGTALSSVVTVMVLLGVLVPADNAAAVKIKNGGQQ